MPQIVALCVEMNARYHPIISSPQLENLNASVSVVLKFHRKIFIVPHSQTSHEVIKCCYRL